MASVMNVDEVTSSQPNSSYTSDSEYDPALANWNKWLKIHEKQQNKLSSQVNRHPQCLVMNTTLNNVYVNQEKNTITEADKFLFCEKYRGHPKFWVTDDNLKNNGKLGLYQTIHRKYDRSRLEQQNKLCLIPEQREYIGVPQAILKEKGISEMPCMPTPQVNWDTSDYVAERREILKDKLELIQEYRPNISALAIVGMQPVQSTPLDETNELLEETVSDSSDSHTYCSCDSNQTQKSVLVMIGETEIEESVEPWTVCYENCLVNETCNIYLTIKNVKESSLRYSWSSVLPTWVNSDLPVKYLKSLGRSFHFNKNDGVILPGCELKILVYFHSSKVGVFRESWKLHLSHESDQWNTKTVQFIAVATERLDSTEYTETIDSYIESCTRYTIARKAVEEMLDKSRSQRQELPYEWKFFEEQIFLHNNPDLFYDNKCVYTLKDLHEKISGGPWDYSVSNLRQELLKRSLNVDCSQEIEIFSSTIYQLLKSNLSACLLNEKQKAVYELLRCFASKIDYEGSNLMLLHQLPISLNHSQGSFQSRQIQRKSSHVSKQSAKSSWLSKNSSRHLNKKSVSNTVDDFVSKPQSFDSGSISSFIFKTRKQEYLESLYVTTYHHLSQTIDQISAIIDSFDAQRKKTMLNHLRNQNI